MGRVPHPLRCVLLGIALAACSTKDPARPAGVSADPSSSASAPAASTTLAASSAIPAEAHPTGHGDPERGRALLAQFECSRCHDGTGAEEPKFEKQCFHCHAKILSGEFEGPKSSMDRWRRNVDPYREAPSLTASQKRLRRSFIEHFLLSPYDLRPRLAATMPRLAITPDQARDLAAALGAPDDPAPPPPAGDAAHGRALIEAKGCPTCHAFTGVPKLKGAAAIKPNERGVSPTLTLAPDLATARDRLRPDALVTWLTSPKAMKPDSAMPELPLTPEEVRDIATYILTADLAPPDPKPAPKRLPILTRAVTFDEVSAKVFRRTCWHCHGEPDYSVGDGGPGNTGGFGFKPRGVSLVDYGTVASGRIDDDGNRQSLFEPAEGGAPRLVAALLARQDEESGHAHAEVRGMPLGYPSLAPEDIQLVESWVAQGRPR